MPVSGRQDPQRHRVWKAPSSIRSSSVPATNGRLRGPPQAAAEVLKGKSVALPYVRLIVTPAGPVRYTRMQQPAVPLKDNKNGGKVPLLNSSGWRPLQYGRTGGILSDQERVVCQQPPQFPGAVLRETLKVEIYLASPRTNAACAVASDIGEFRRK